MKLFTKIFQFLILLLIIENTIQAPLAGECASICSELKNEVEDLLKKVVDDINKKHNKNLLVGNIDRVEKTQKETSINYVINVFISKYYPPINPGSI